MTGKLDSTLTRGRVLGNPHNAVRYRAQPRWFDFYNCRVVLPDQGVFFFVMPYLLSGEGIPGDRAGLYILDGANGCGERRGRTGVERIRSDDWWASTSGCGVFWRRDGRDQFFTERHIRMTTPYASWDVQIEPWLSDGGGQVAEPRRVDIVEKLLLRGVPFIHRVPHMKGLATGVIECEGQRYVFDRGVVYQAKNHGPTLPARWTWIHANAFAEDDTLAFEVAANPTKNREVAMIRISRPGVCRVLTTWEGSNIRLSRSGTRYEFVGTSADGTLRIAGEATHGEAIVFRVAAPNGGTFEIDEDLMGVLSVTIDGRVYTTRYASVGVAYHHGEDVG
jgi:hypothetical protein